MENTNPGYITSLTCYARRRPTQEQRRKTWHPTDRTSRTRFSTRSARQKVSVTIFLVNGVKLQGVITWFDNFCILLRRDGQSQLVYKHAVSTIMPSQPISLYDGDESA